MTAPLWWQTGVFYQVYPRSFADGNGDGVGDFPGITAKLDYLRDLGIDAIWLSPHFPSPQVDLGYDISDYTGVAPEYGTLDDFRTFLAEAHARNIRVVLDLVLNHTSDQHDWFKESRSSRTSAKRDWYVWREPAPDGGPPNNWNSVFGGSAWEFDPTTGQYYYHMFLTGQPDLNWRNPEVHRAMWAAARFWLDMGVDGFRLDAIGTMFEDPDLPNHDSTLDMRAVVSMFRDNPSPEEQQRMQTQFARMFRYQMQQPGMHALMQELRRVVDTYPDRVLIGEDDDIAYYGNGHDELHMIFNFPLMLTNRITPEHVRANQALRLSQLPPGAWPCNTLGNHDRPRVWSAYADGRNDAALARLHAALMLMLRGTPFLYNGEEIGMTDYLVESYDQLRDNQAVNYYHIAVESGASPELALSLAAQMSRDRCRTPHQWTSGPNAGFCPPGATSWLPANPNADLGVNVAAQEHDPDSMLSFYRRLLGVRRANPALQYGEYAALGSDQHVLAFERTTANQRVLVVMNYSDAPRAVTLTDGAGARTLFSNRGRSGVVGLDPLTLAPFEIYIGMPV